MAKVRDNVFVDVNYNNQFVIKHLLSNGSVNRIHLDKKEAFELINHLFDYLVKMGK